MPHTHTCVQNTFMTAHCGTAFVVQVLEQGLVSFFPGDCFF
jgi:hypothetical protein